MNELELGRCYRPLTFPDEIRILYLTFDGPEASLTGCLVHARLDERPFYEAISYAWGDSTRSRTISIEYDEQQYDLPITEALFQLLLDLRHEDAADDDRVVWVDGVCIDQENLFEREQQVRIMGSIYREAARVVTYLGPEEDDSNEAIDFAYYLWKGVLSETSTLSSTGSIVKGLPPESDPRCQALQKLFLRSWCGRCWCGQEFLLNERLTLLCGRREIKDWWLLPSIVQFVFNRTIPAYLLPPSSANPGSLTECLTMISRTREALVEAERKFELFELLQRFHPLQSTDPRDKIYALLNLAADRELLGVRIDYGCSVTELYTQVAARLIELYRPLDLLYSNLGVKDYDLPSWVPDWSTWRFGTHGMVFDLYLEASGNSVGSLRVVDGTKLEVKGSILDRISYLSSRVGPRYTRHASVQSLPTALCSAQSTHLQMIEEPLLLNEWYALQLERIEGLQPYPDGASAPKETLWRTLTTNSTFLEKKATADYEVYFDAHLDELINTTVDGSTIEGDEKELNTLEALHVGRTKMAREFRDTARRRMRYRRTCTTENGYYGAAPEESLAGDLICLIEGAHSLFVIRRKRAESAEYELVGPAYVHGLMYGEALRMDNYASVGIVLA